MITCGNVLSNLGLEALNQTRMGGSGVAVGLNFHGSNCGGSLTDSVYLRPTPPANSWEADSILVTVPSGVDSAYLAVYTEQVLYMDQLYVNKVNSF